MKISLMILLALLAPSVAHAECVRHSPYVRVAERVQLADDPTTVTNEVTVRNTDGCQCGRSCFQLSSGWHPPNNYPEPSPSIRVKRTSLEHNYVCLNPGEERKTVLTVEVNPQLENDPPGYATPVVFADRSNRVTLPCYAKNDEGVWGWGTGCFEEEGGVICQGFTEAECAQFEYPAGAAH